MNDSVQILDLSEIKSVAVSDGAQGPRPAHPEKCMHAHPHYELLYITRGAREFYSSGKFYKAEAGDLIIFYPWMPHIEYAGTPKISYFAFRLSLKDLEASHVEFPKIRKNIPVINLPHKQEFLRIFNAITEESTHRKDGREILMGTYLVEFIIKLRRAIHEASPSSKKKKDAQGDRIDSAMDILQKNVEHSLNLKKLAQQTFMSVSHLSHSFKDQVGESPRRFQIRERIKQAKLLLLETNKPASEIAEQLGYNSVYFFYRQFRKKTGMTTVEFRERFSP